MASRSWREGFNKDVSTWLNARGWQDEPPPETAAPAARHAPESFAARDAREKLEREQRAAEARVREAASSAESQRIIAEADAEFERQRAGGKR